jgi:hypothetical protein
MKEQQIITTKKFIKFCKLVDIRVNSPDKLIILSNLIATSILENKE